MQRETLQVPDDEISIRDMVGFFKRNQKGIILGGLAGLLFSAIHVVLTPNKYEARWQIQMAQSVNINNNGSSYNYGGNYSNNNSFSNIEEPSALIQWLRAPTAYPPEVKKSCGVQGNGDFNDYLGGFLKVDSIKNVPNVIDVKVSATSREQAIECAGAVTGMIVAQQHGLIMERLSGRRQQLAEYKQTLIDEHRQLEKIKESELGNFGYLARLDKLSWLRTRIYALQEEVMLSQLHPAKLVAPIYVSDKPVAPKIGWYLSMGVLLGLILGAVYVLGREGWRKLPE